MKSFNLTIKERPESMSSLMYIDNVYAMPYVNVVDSLESLKNIVTNVQHSSYEWANGVRNSLNLIAVNGIIMDFDDKTTIEAFKESTLASKYNWILYTSKSHQIAKVNKPAVDRFHVFFPFESRFKVTDENREECWESVSNFVELVKGMYGLNPDKQVSDTARFVHPSRERGKAFSSTKFEIVEYSSGSYLSFDLIHDDWVTLLAKRGAEEKTREKTAPGKEKFNNSEFVNMLEWLAKDKYITYEQFRDIGFFINKNYAEGDAAELFAILNKNPRSHFTLAQTLKKGKQLYGRGENNVIGFGRMVTVCKEVSEYHRETMLNSKEENKKSILDAQNSAKIKQQELKELKGKVKDNPNDADLIIEKQKVENEINTLKTTETLATVEVKKIDATIHDYSYSALEMKNAGVQEIIDVDTNEVMRDRYETDIKFNGLNCIDFFNSFCAYYSKGNEYIVNKKGNIIDFLKKEAMENEFASLKITNVSENDKGVKKEVSMPAFKVWNESNKRRTVDHLINEPLKMPKHNEYNMCYEPYTLEPMDYEKDEIKVFTNYVLTALCSGDKNLAEYLIKWVAAVTQFKKTKVAIVLKGEHGSGKTTLSTIFSKMLSPTYSYVTGNIKNVTGDFNVAIQNKVAITLEEAVFHKDYNTLSQLKDMITNDSISINEKFKSMKDLKSLSNFILTSNASEVVQIEASDRRYCVIQTNPDYAKYINNKVNPLNVETFNTLHNWLQNENGYAKLLKFLTEMKVDVLWLQNNIPTTEAKLNDKLTGLNQFDSWLYEVITNNYWLYDSHVNDMVNVSGTKKPYVTVGKLYNLFASGQKFSDSMAKFAILLNDVSEIKKLNVGNIRVFDTDKIVKYFEKKGIEVQITPEEPTPTGTDGKPKTKKEETMEKVAKAVIPEVVEAQICPTINEIKKVVESSTTIENVKPVVTEIPRITTLKNSHPVVVEFLDKCRFIDIEVLEDLFTVQSINLLTGELLYREFKTGDMMTESMFMNMIGSQRAMAWNNGYENTMLAYLFDDLQGCVDTELMKKYNDLIMQDKVEPMRVSKPLVIRDITQFNADWTQVLAFGGKPKTLPKALKQIQIQYGVSHEFFDFDKYDSIAQVKADGLYDKFVSYAKNDVSSVRDLVLNELLSKMQMVVEAMESIGKEFKTEDLFYYSGFGLINKAFATGQKAEDFDDYQFKALNNDDANVFFSKINNPATYKTLEAIEFKIMGATGSIGQGGLHAVHDSIKDYQAEDGRTGEDIDVVSMYPHIIVANASRFPQIDVDLYKSVIKTRLKAKKEGLKSLSEGLKLLLNSTYGILGLAFESNSMYSKQSQLLVSFYGQHSIVDLLERIEAKVPGAVLIQANTDGVMIDIAVEQKSLVNEIVSAWEKEYKLTMEFGSIDFLHQDNVNNYFYTNKDGKLKAKGSFDSENDSAMFGSFYKPISTQIEVTMNQIQGLPIDSIEPKPYYLKPRSNDKGNFQSLVKYQPIYLTTKDKTELYLERKGENIYFTTDKNLADINCYVEGFYNENQKAKELLKRQKADEKVRKQAEKEAEAKRKEEAKKLKEANKKTPKKNGKDAAKEAIISEPITNKDVENYLTKHNVTEEYMRLKAAEELKSYEEWMQDLIELDRACDVYF